MSSVWMVAPSAHAAPNFKDKLARPLHFRPDNGAFVVENGAEFFNRPLYGSNTAFRVDAGDRPQLSLYMPGRGGVLRLGIETPAGRKWLDQAETITARYVPGSMQYEIRDALLEAGTLRLEVQAMAQAEGVVVRAQISGTRVPVDLVWAYGGANGERAARNGDIGTERIPISQYFQLKADHCKDSKFEVQNNSFTLRTNRNSVAGLAPTESKFTVADARHWSQLGELVKSEGRAEIETPVIVTRARLNDEKPTYLSLERTGNGTEAKAGSYKVEELPVVFGEAEKRRREIAQKVQVFTPDPYIDAAVSALCVAADGVWDDKSGIFMHGGVAWRSPYLGWRGGYAGTSLGWPDRTVSHLGNWFKKQNVEPVPPGAAEPMPVAGNPAENFARNELALHSNGDLTNHHYDMNLVGIDILFRQLMWSGDMQYAREVWPVIERHMAWERRMFRRPFGPQKLPLYEAYACIWASDDLQYSGGGVTHSSAYNYFHNLTAARIAKAIGKDASIYEKEARLILKAMQSQLWLNDRGWYGEWKDLLGLQKVHPNAALWTFYHTVDSEVPSGLESWQMSRFVDTQIPKIPVHGPGVPAGNYFTLPSTTWMPYTWSTNNVVMAEAAHTALGYWQSGRGDVANRLFKGLLLDSMYLGLTPGNVGMCTYYDMARGETQRDFADGVGATSRALIEGLFGVKPDALEGVVRVQPGFPSDWDRAEITHQNFEFNFRRQGLRDTYRIAPKFRSTMRLQFTVPAVRDQVESVLLNGKPVQWTSSPESVGTPRIEIQHEALKEYQISIIWRGQVPQQPVSRWVEPGDAFEIKLGTARVLEVADPQQVLSEVRVQNGTLSAKATGGGGDRSVFARVQQGDMKWWLPVDLSVRPVLDVVLSESQNDTHLKFRLRNNSPRVVKQSALVHIDGLKPQRLELNIGAGQLSTELSLPARGLLPGTHLMKIELGQGQTIWGEVANWRLPVAQETRMETLDLGGVLNDKVTRIFQNEYLSPRSPYVSLAIPKQGIGSWASLNEKYEVDDSGLRKLGGQLMLPQGVPFKTPGGEANNIAFTSQWDNYPKDVEIPLEGSASHLYLLMAGSTNSMQSRFENGEVWVTCADGSSTRLALENPKTWWPINEDYRIDDFAFNYSWGIPPRVELATGRVRLTDVASFKGQSGKVNGGAATVLDLPLDNKKTLKSLKVRCLANEVVIGLMAATLVRN